jgi:hypothetical protein
MAIPVLPTPAPNIPARRWAATALACTAAGALLLVARGAPFHGSAPAAPDRAGVAAAAGRAVVTPGSWRPVRLPVPADGALSRYPILLRDDTSGVYFEPGASDQAP